MPEMGATGDFPDGKLTESEPKLNQNQDVQAKSVALLRLIDEVRVGEDIRLDAYNRVYSRHNRSI